MKRIYIENAYFVFTVFNFRKNKCCQLSFTHIAFLHVPLLTQLFWLKFNYQIKHYIIFKRII